MSVSIFPEGEIRVFVGSGSTIHRWMRLGPKLKMGEKNACRDQFPEELSPVPSRQLSVLSCRAYIDFLLLFAYSFVIFRIFQIILLLQPGAYAFLLACEICTCTLVHGVMYDDRPQY
eukprot:COSAG02_NODE_3339_length_6902_cov_59.760694_3_plen_117_part_00